MCGGAGITGWVEEPTLGGKGAITSPRSEGKGKVVRVSHRERSSGFG